MIELPNLYKLTKHRATRENPAGVYMLDIKKSARKKMDVLSDNIALEIDKDILSLRHDPFPHPLMDGIRSLLFFRGERLDPHALRAPL